MKFFVLLLICFVLISGHEWAPNTKVQHTQYLGQASLSKLMKLNNGFVMFYQTWCGHCKTLMPEFEKAAAINTDPSVTFIAIDCGQAQQACEKMGVKGYPTLYFIKDSQRFYKYQSGQRQAQNILDFVQTGYAKAQVTNMYLIEQAAKKEKEQQAQKLVDFQQQSPHMDFLNYKEILGRKNQFIFLYASYCGHCKKFIPTFQQLQEKYKDSETLEFIAVDVKSKQADNQPFSTVFGVTGFPTLVYVHGDDFYRFKKGRTAEAIENFINKEEFLQIEKKDDSDVGTLTNVKERLLKIAKSKEKQRKRKEKEQQKREGNTEENEGNTTKSKKNGNKNENYFQQFVGIFDKITLKLSQIINVEPQVGKVIFWVGVSILFMILKQLFFAKKISKKNQGKKSHLKQASTQKKDKTE